MSFPDHFPRGTLFKDSFPIRHCVQSQNEYVWKQRDTGGLIDYINNGLIVPGLTFNSPATFCNYRSTKIFFYLLLEMIAFWKMWA
jgi:hypothetical protein